MRKIFLGILVLALIFGTINCSQSTEKIQVIDKQGKKIVKVAGAHEDFIGEGFRNLNEKQKKFLDCFLDMVSAEFSEIIHSEIKNIGMTGETYWGIRGMSSKKFAILLHSFEMGIITDEENRTGEIFKSELAFLYYFDDLQTLSETEKGSLLQIAESIARKSADNIKEKIEKTKWSEFLKKEK